MVPTWSVGYVWTCRIYRKSGKYFAQARLLPPLGTQLCNSGPDRVSWTTVEYQSNNRWTFAHHSHLERLLVCATRHSGISPAS
jgi:hypothetical protein